MVDGTVRKFNNQMGFDVNNDILIRHFFFSLENSHQDEIIKFYFVHTHTVYIKDIKIEHFFLFFHHKTAIFRYHPLKTLHNMNNNNNQKIEQQFKMIAFELKCKNHMPKGFYLSFHISYQNSKMFPFCFHLIFHKMVCEYGLRMEG